MRCEGVEFVRRWWRTPIGPGDDAHAAGRASGMPAAHRKMGNMVGATRFEYGPATRHAHGAPGICDRHQIVAKTLERRDERSARSIPRRSRRSTTHAGRRSPAPARPVCTASRLETLALNPCGGLRKQGDLFSIARNPRTASTGNNNAAPNRIRRRRWYQIRRPNAKLSPMQPCTHPGTSNAICRPSRFECQSIQTTWA